MSVIEIKNLTKMYGKERGISNLNMKVTVGEIFGFIGPNGAGKTTTIRLLLGLIHPTSGSATIFRKDIAQFGPEIREEIGYLPSEVFYYDAMRVQDLLEYSASFYKKPKADMHKKMVELAQLLDLDMHKKIDDLSYGNKKKVGIIQGLLHSPKLIILDEPTGGLDPLMQQTFFHLLKQENKNGATVLFSSHNLSEVQKICDRVAIIKDGEIIKIERVAHLRENNYKKIQLELIALPNKQRFSLPGVSNVQISGTSVSFLFRGNINSLSTLLVALDLKNVTIEEPELEEIFMHYYQKEQ